MQDTELVGQEKQHVSWLVKWKNTDELRHLLNARRKTNVAEQEAELNKDTANDKFFIIINRRKPVGQCGITDINWRNRTGKIFLYLGEKDSLAQGIGTQATQLLLDYAFSVLGLHKVKIDVIAYNIGLLKLCNKLGFKMDVRRRQHHLFENMYYNVFELSMTKSEFEDERDESSDIPDREE